MTSSITRRDAPYARGETALLFVDIQEIFCRPGLDPTHSDMTADHYYFKRLRDTAIPNQVALLAAARAAGVPVLHTIIEALTKDGRDISLDHRLSNIFIPKGLPEGQPIRELTPIDNEIVLPKSSSGVFNSTAIDYVLRNMGIRFLVVAGVVTDQCVDMAVRDAADRGYAVSVAADACATYTQERHDAALRAFGGYGWITDTATIVARFRALPA
ncbi:MAG: isochorismatase family cysteine hydrolase [Hyphomicrobiales bacterium]